MNIEYCIHYIQTFPPPCTLQDYLDYYIYFSEYILYISIRCAYSKLIVYVHLHIIKVIQCYAGYIIIYNYN